MTLSQKVSVFIVLLIIAFASGWLNFSQDKQVDSKPEDHALKEAVNTCDGITERAASHLVAVVEYQKLEIAGRKARVFKMCMEDRGYIENKDWLKYSAPIAEKTAKTTQVSVDEALENLRRANMVVAHGEQSRPSYWIRKTANPETAL